MDIQPTPKMEVLLFIIAVFATRTYDINFNKPDSVNQKTGYSELEEMEP